MRHLIVLLMVMGCGAPIERTAPPPQMGYLVLLQGSDGLRTEWRDEDGALRGRADGALVGVGDRLHRFESRARRIALRSCGEIVEDPETGMPREPSGTVASALLVGIGSDSLELIGPAADGAIQEYAAHDEVHAVLAALGDRIVILSRRARNGCGVHGETSVTLRTFDLGTGEELLERTGERDPLRARGPEALAALRALDPNRSAGCLGSDLVSAERRASVPAFGVSGVSSRHLFAVAVPGACGTLDAPTSSYEWGIWLDGPAAELPPAYRERSVPEAVLRHAGGAVGVTWMRADRAPMGDAFAVTD